jgi:hypothetical protein
MIPDPDLDFYPYRIPDPGVKKAPDPGSATLPKTKIFFKFRPLQFLLYLHKTFEYRITVLICFASQSSKITELSRLQNNRI